MICVFRCDLSTLTQSSYLLMNTIHTLQGMVHVVAGPAVLRQLSAQGADCLNLNTLSFIEEPQLFLQCYAGTRQAYLDARSPKNRPAVYNLVKDADVFVENLRPHMAAQEGYSPETMAEIRPGIIYVTIKFNTETGPWSDWLGYDFTAAGLCGLLTQLGSPDQPMKPNKVQVVCDFLTGYLASIGVQAALLRRAKEGGSYKVTVTLSQTVMFEQMIGLVKKTDLLKLSEMGDDHKPLPPNLQTGQTVIGEFTRVGSQIEMSKTPEYWETVFHPIGSSKPEWLPKDK